jgi:hypothetical protein
VSAARRSRWPSPAGSSATPAAIGSLPDVANEKSGHAQAGRSGSRDFAGSTRDLSLGSGMPCPALRVASLPGREARCQRRWRGRTRPQLKRLDAILDVLEQQHGLTSWLRVRRLGSGPERFATRY